jgi:hypothetical protein
MRYLADHGVPVLDEPPDEVALAELGVVRVMVQRLLEPSADSWTDEGRALLAAATYALDDEGRIACTQTGWRGFCRDLLVPLFALVENRAGLRRCANPACRLLFEDGSPDHARRWCDTAGCGNRDRVRIAHSRDAGALKSHADAPASNP